MRVLHLSDLHFGRDFAGLSRREEQEKLVAELVDAAKQEDADVAVIAGDIYDTANPPAWAEDAFYALLDGLAEGGRRAVVVIAGNHDNALRLSAAEPLARRLGIWLAGTRDDAPAAFDGGSGKVRVDPLGIGAAFIQSSDRSRSLGVGALPYVSEVALVRRAQGPMPSEGHDREAYGRGLSQLFAERAALLPTHAPRLLAGHLWVTGAMPTDSERVYRVGALTDLPASLLPEADYVALGHLHRPQRVGTGSTPIVYSGSPISYSLSEAGQQKRAVLVEVGVGSARMHDLPLSSGRPVEAWKASNFADLRFRAQSLSGPMPIVALTLDLGRPASRAELEELHDLGPSFLRIDVVGDVTGDETADGTLLAPELPDDVLARSFLTQQLGREPEPELLAELLGLLSGEPEPVVAPKLQEAA